MVHLIDLPSTNLFALSETPTGDGNGIPEIERASGTSLVRLISSNEPESLDFSAPYRARDAMSSTLTLSLQIRYSTSHVLRPCAVATPSRTQQ